MPSVYPPIYSTPVGQVRLLIPDTAHDEDNLYLFEDEQLDALLDLYNNNVKRAAAQAKSIIAGDTVMLLKVIRTDDLQVDGAKVAAELRVQAKDLRDEANKADQDDLFDYFTIVYPEQDLYPEAVPVWGRARVEIVSR